MDVIKFRFLISLIVLEELYIYMKNPEGFKLPKANITNPRKMYLIKIQLSLYELKQFIFVWYNCLSEYLLKEGYM